MNNPIIYGKNDQQNIVNIEDNGNGTTDLYIQQEDGSVVTSTVSNEYWILSDEYTDNECRKLEGNGYYKYLNPFTLRSDFQQAKKHFKKFGDKAWWVNDAKESFMLSEGCTYYKGLKQKDVSVLAFDIETTTLEHNKDAKVLIIANTFRNSKGDIERKLFCYDEYKGPKQMLEAWCNWVQDKDPSIVTGHHILGFDLLYLDYIASTVNCELTLGRKGKAIKFNSWSSKFRKDGSQFLEYYKCNIPGREIVDTMFLAYKWDISRSLISYGLKPIISQLGLEKKDRAFYDASLIRKNYTISNEWKKIKDYAIDDGDDALVLWDLMGPSAFYWCQKVPKSLQEVVSGASGSQLNSILVRSYLQNSHSLPKASRSENFKGAISIGVPGVYRNCLKLDIKSMYPSIIIQYKLFNKEKDPEGNFLKITEILTEQRFEHKRLAKETKDSYYSDLEQSEKTGINSLYGLANTNGLLFNSPDIGEFITRKGREILEFSIKWATSKTLKEFGYEE